MPAQHLRPLYRHRGVAMLRAAADPLPQPNQTWPDLSDMDGCRAWLKAVWARRGFADAVRVASPGLADRLDQIVDGSPSDDKQVRRATMSAVRYLVRSTSRQTPFGLFAGVATASAGKRTQVRWGHAHHAVARADTQWLADVVNQLESSLELVERLDVVFTDLAVRRGARLEAPHGPDRVSIRYTSALDLVYQYAASPMRFAVLADKLADAFPATPALAVRGMLAELVGKGLLVTCLRAPLTVIDPLAHVVDRLEHVKAGQLRSVAPILSELAALRSRIGRHNDGKSGSRNVIAAAMRELSSAGRTPLAVDLRLDCEVQVPEHVIHEVERAASALARLTRQPTGEAPWREFYAAFCDRYGAGTLVPLADVVDTDSGLGFPAGYPGSVFAMPSGSVSERDKKLLRLAWQAMADGSREIVLDEDTIADLTVGDPVVVPRIPPHVEMAARVHATSTEALDQGHYTITVSPARSAGTFTSRFTGIIPDSGLPDVYAAVPTAVEGALAVQLSFPPAYPHAENVCRVPAYLPQVLSLGEHRDGASIRVDDLVVTATRDSLHLVSMSRQQVVEPQVFHALALEKQPPPLGRFLAHLPRALGAAWHEFDWGPNAQSLPFLPRVRYRRSVLSPARWRLTNDDLPKDPAAWTAALDHWRHRWNCPDVVELRDADRSLRLRLDEPAHVAILYANLHRAGDAVLIEVADHTDFGWIGGHAHEIVIPLFTTRPATKSPLTRRLSLVNNRSHGQPPGCPETTCLYAKIHTHPDRMDEIIATRLSDLPIAAKSWFVRYRSPHETDHLRLRIPTPSGAYADYAAEVGAWAQQLRHDGLAGRLAFDTYHAEVGRYGTGDAMTAAEQVFAADSRVVITQLRNFPAAVIHPQALAALNFVGIAEGFLGSLPEAMRWLITRPAVPFAATDRTLSDQVARLARGDLLHTLPGWVDEVAEAWHDRAFALRSYRPQLSPDTDFDAVLEALLHMHHNRTLGIDRGGENSCRRLARHAARAWTSRQDVRDR